MSDCWEDISKWRLRPGVMAANELKLAQNTTFCLDWHSRLEWWCLGASLKYFHILCVLTFTDLKIILGSAHKYAEVTGDLGYCGREDALETQEERCEGFRCFMFYSIPEDIQIRTDSSLDNIWVKWRIFTLWLGVKVIMMVVCRQDDDEKMGCESCICSSRDPSRQLLCCLPCSWQAKNVLQPLINEEAVTAAQIAYRRYKTTNVEWV